MSLPYCMNNCFFFIGYSYRKWLLHQTMLAKFLTFGPGSIYMTPVFIFLLLQHWWYFLGSWDIASSSPITHQDTPATTISFLKKRSDSGKWSSNMVWLAVPPPPPPWRLDLMVVLLVANVHTELFKLCFANSVFPSQSFASHWWIALQLFKTYMYTILRSLWNKLKYK